MLVLEHFKDFSQTQNTDTPRSLYFEVVKFGEMLSARIKIKNF